MCCVQSSLPQQTLIHDLMMSGSSYPAAPPPWNHQGPTKPWRSIKFPPFSCVKRGSQDGSAGTGLLAAEQCSSAARKRSHPLPTPKPRAHPQLAEGCPGRARRTWTGRAPCWACRAPRPSPAPGPWSPVGSRTPARPRRTPAGCSSPRHPPSATRSHWSRVGVRLCHWSLWEQQGIPDPSGSSRASLILPLHPWSLWEQQCAMPMAQQHQEWRHWHLTGPELRVHTVSKVKSLTNPLIAEIFVIWQIGNLNAFSLNWTLMQSPKKRSLYLWRDAVLPQNC